MAFSVMSSAFAPLGHQRPHGVDDLGPAAVVEREGQRQPAVVPGQRDGLVLLGEEPARHPPVPAPGEADPHAQLVELVTPAHQDLPVEPHEVAHLVDRSTPVLGREGVDGQPAQAEIQRALDRVEERLLARRVAVGPLEPPLGRPPPVAVHHAGDVAGDAPQVEPLRHRGRARLRIPDVVGAVTHGRTLPPAARRSGSRSSAHPPGGCGRWVETATVVRGLRAVAPTRAVALRQPVRRPSAPSAASPPRSPTASPAPARPTWRRPSPRRWRAAGTSWSRPAPAPASPSPTSSRPSSPAGPRSWPPPRRPCRTSWPRRTSRSSPSSSTSSSPGRS